jgi:hypothetical protein
MRATMAMRMLTESADRVPPSPRIVALVAMGTGRLVARPLPVAASAACTSFPRAEMPSLGALKADRTMEFFTAEPVVH